MNKRLTDIFIEVISIEGISANERKVADYITSFLKNINLKPLEEQYEKLPEGNTGNIICPVGTGGNFVLLSHMDTARSTAGVKPYFGADRITSDGTTVLGVDNRAGIACLLYSIEKLVLEKKPLSDFTIAFTVQEETTLYGSMSVELNGKIKKGFVFDSHTRPGNVICQSAGSIGFTIKIFGKASHSGIAPEKGIDSVKIAADAISKIKFGKIDEDTTANIGIIRGGSATNIIPELTVIDGEVRSMVPSKIENKIKEIEKVFTETSIRYGGSCEMNSSWNFKPYNVAPESDTYKMIERAIKNAGLNPVRNSSKGGSDANSLNEKGIECVNLGIGAENPHSNDEFILYEDLEKTAQIVMELMKQ